MNKKIKIISAFIVITLVLNIVAPIVNVFAARTLNPAQTANLVEIILRSATNVSIANGTATITYDGGTATVTANGLQSDLEDAFNYGDHTGNMYYLYTTDSSVTFNLTPGTNKTAYYWDNGQKQAVANNTKTLTNLLTKTQNPMGYQTEFTFEGTGTGTETNTSATINITAGAGTYKDKVRDPNTHQEVEQDVNYDHQIELLINGSRYDPNNTTIDYKAAATDTTVVVSFECLWNERFYEDIVINGTTYQVSNYIDFDDRTSWLTHNNGTQSISFSITNVPKAAAYNIVVKHGRNNKKTYLATFLWTADPAQAGSHNYIGNSKIEFVKAVYEVGGTQYTVTEDQIKENATKDGNFDTFRSPDGFLQFGVLNNVDFDDGSLTLPGEAQITMRVVPQYGYQVTSVNGGADFTTTNDGVSEFTITVHDGEAGYFQAEVTKVDDVLIANSNKVTSGSVDITNGDIDAGTVRLSVDDVELTPEQISNFEQNAGNGYDIKTYLDINLNKVLYKGTEDDVWSEQIHHLNNKALITLKLADGVDINNLVIVHNIDNGDQFEIIQIESYDPVTNTITFYTDSFSNYALATKVSTGTPKTGDDIALFITTFVIASLGLLVTIKLNKRI